MARVIRHGTYAGAVANCKCDPCSAARTKYKDNRRRQIAYGRWNPWGDIEQVRAHLNTLRARGFSSYRISVAAGRSTSHINALASGRLKRVTAEIADSILAVTPDAPSYIPADGARRRLQAVATQGWGVAAIHEETGVAKSVLHRVRGGSKRSITPATNDRVAAFYDRRSMSWAPDGQPAARARTDAKKHGWLPPLAWDDSLIDLPEAELQAEIDRQVEAMDYTELGRCHRAVRDGERSPVIVAASRAYLRVRKARTTLAA